MIGRDQTRFFVWLKSKRLCICVISLSFSSSPRLFQNIGEYGAKKYLTGLQTASKILLFITMKENLSGLFFL